MKTLEQAIREIENKGFTHMKFELEANFNLEGEQECYECDGSGQLYDSYEDEETECQYCDGSGYQNRGEPDYDDLTNYITNTISEQARQEMTFGMAYHDGSVDTEYTFTVTLEGVKYVPEIMRAFEDYCNNEGGDFDTNGAGFHIAVLTEGTYPCNKQLNDDYTVNFINQVTRLLPALYHEATGNNKTRSTYYRTPQIEYKDRASGYPAIRLHSGTMEYRIFDPCFDKPEQVFEYIKVISNTLKYYSKRKLKKSLYEKFEVEITDTKETTGVGKLYSTPENIQALQSTLKYVNPDGKLKIKIPDKYKGTKLKYAKLIRDTKKYELYAENIRKEYHRSLHREWVNLAKWQEQTRRLSDLEKISAKEYLDIKRDERYPTSVITEQVGTDSAKTISAEQYLKMYKEYINRRVASFRDWQEQQNSNRLRTTTITG